jgi:mycothiol synthase
VRVLTKDRVEPDDVTAITTLLDDVRDASGHPAIDAERWDAFATGTAADSTAILTHGSNGDLVGYAQVTGRDPSIVEVAVHPRTGDAGASTTVALLKAALDVVRKAGGGPVQHWVFGVTDIADRAARSVGLTPGRELWQLRRSLPVDEPYELAARAFVVGQDEHAWLAVNNRAFHGHPDQSDWTLADLEAREGEPWFDPDGFLMHERDGRLAGFCWTKVHDETDPPLGEIYVIATDPDFQGRGLGRKLVLAGLDSLARRGLDIGMLYVDATNTGAVRLYDAMGFVKHETDRVYDGEVR